MTTLEFIDSSGLYVLLRARDGSRPAALVQAPGSHVGSVLEIVHAGQAVPIHDDLGKAIKKLS